MIEHPEQPPEDSRTWPTAPATPSTPPQPAYPPAPEYYQPGYGQQGAYPPPAAWYPPGAYPPASYYPPAGYPPPPEYYQPGQQGAQPPAAPGYPGYPGYPPGYTPYPQYGSEQQPTYPSYGYGQQPSYPPHPQYGYGPYPGQPQYPQYPQYPGYAPQPVASRTASVSAPRSTSLAVGLLWTIVSGVVSFAVYAQLLGWQFGLGMIALLLVHEMGHFVVIRAKGLPAGLPIFIPLVGAFVTMRRAPQGVRDEAEIALAGPLAGTVGGVICLLAYWQSGLPVLLPLAYFSFYLNLLNLIPVGPLDGARVTGAISKWIWPVGLVGVAIGAWYTKDTLLILLVVVGAFQLFSRFGAASASSYYSISLGVRAYVTLLYFGLAGVLAYATYALQPLMAANGHFF